MTTTKTINRRHKSTINRRLFSLSAEVPFSSVYKFMASVHEPVEQNDTSEYMDKLIVHAKGF